MMFMQRRINVDATSMQRYNAALTSMQRHDVASTLMRRYINIMMRRLGCYYNKCLNVYTF